MNVPVTDLEGNPCDDNGKPAIVGRFVAQTLAGSAQGDAVKFLDWALALYNGKPLTVDGSDLEALRDHIKKSQAMTNLVKGQALKLLQNGG